MRTYTYYIHKQEDKYDEPDYAVTIYRRSVRFNLANGLRFWAFGYNRWRSTNLSMSRVKPITFKRFCKKPYSKMKCYDLLKKEWAILATKYENV